jgi:hypothetical protein
MYILVTGSGVSLKEPEDTKTFRISLAAPSKDLDRVLRASGWGMIDGAEALVDVEVLRHAASGRVTASWDNDFEIMIDYARSHGWLSPDERFVRAHVEPEHVNIEPTGLA